MHVNDEYSFTTRASIVYIFPIRLSVTLLSTHPQRIDLRRLRCTGTPTASATRTVRATNRVACVIRVSRLKAM